jgi:hypothetical protein
MKAGPVDIGSLLQNRNRYCVPIYQRRYVWTKSKQWEPFWQDIRSKAIERLAGRERRFSHFMGAVVLESRAKPSVKQVQSFQVVDGQQRLTTFQLFLTAARHYAQSIGYASAESNLQRFVLNSDPDLMEHPEVEIFKVWPTQGDRALFVDIVLSRNRKDLQSKYGQWWYKNEKRDQVQEYLSVPNPLGAYGYFYDRIRHSAESDDLHSDLQEVPDDAVSGSESDGAIPRQLKLDAIWQALLEEFKVVEIILDEGDDAQVIFETLNDRGEPLLAADLVRNNIFQRADAALGPEKAEKLFSKYWKSFDDPFWSELEKQGRYRKQRVEFFLANFMAGQIGGEVALSKLFSEYKAFLRPRKGSTTPRYSSVEDELRDLEGGGAVYREFIEAQASSPLARFSRRLRNWDVATANPLIVRLWREASLELDVRAQMLEVLMSYIVRRAVCGLTTKNYNNVFLSAITQLDRSGWGGEGLRNFFKNQKSDSGRFPTDEEFCRSFVSAPIYRILGPAKVRALLMEMEAAKRGRFQEITKLPDDLSVEHIMPTAWRKKWPMADGSMVSQDQFDLAELWFQEDDSIHGRIAARIRLKDTIGNLTLVTKSFNGRLSNHAYSEKKGEFEAQSLLMLNKELTRKTRWREQEIMKRSESLADSAIGIWRGF